MAHRRASAEVSPFSSYMTESFFEGFVAWHCASGSFQDLQASLQTFRRMMRLRCQWRTILPDLHPCMHLGSSTCWGSSIRCSSGILVWNQGRRAHWRFWRISSLSKPQRFCSTCFRGKSCCCLEVSVGVHYQDIFAQRSEEVSSWK